MLHIFRDKKGEWRWHVKARNGRIVADSGEGYTRKSRCVAMADRLFAVNKREMITFNAAS